MTSPQRSSQTSKPPLNRWKSRFLFVQKPMFWIASSVLVLVGFMISDYSSIRSRQQANEPPQSEEINTGSTESQSTSDSTRFADDPELREWAASQGISPLNADVDTGSTTETETELSNDLNTSNTVVDETRTSQAQSSEITSDTISGIINESLGSNDLEENSLLPTFADSNTRSENTNTSDPESSVVGPISDSLSSTIISNNDILEMLGVNSSAPRSVRTNTRTNVRTNVSLPTLNDTNNTTEEERSLPLSALAKALNALQPNSPSEFSDPLSRPLGETFPQFRSPVNNAQNELNPAQSNTVPPVASFSTTQGLTIQSIPPIQTSPPPGTTGYVAPPPLPGTTSSHTSPRLSTLQAPTGSTIPLNPLNTTPPSASTPTTLPPQPTVTLPQVQPTPSVPSPVFPPTLEQDHIPYTGGGRNGQINTFSNP